MPSERVATPPLKPAALVVGPVAAATAYDRAAYRPESHRPAASDRHALERADDEQQRTAIASSSAVSHARWAIRAAGSVTGSIDSIVYITIFSIDSQQQESTRTVGLAAVIARQGN